MTRILYILFIYATFSAHLYGQVIARLVKAEGRIYFKRLGMNTFSEEGRAGASIRNGDQIKVRENSFAAIIYLDDRSILKVRENTTFSFMDTRNSRTVDIVKGTLLNDIKKEGRTKDYRIQTPVSVASVKGTEFAAIVSQTGVDQFICKEGRFEVLNMISGETVSVGAGEKAVSNATGNLVQAPSSPGEYPPDPEIEEPVDLEPEKDTKKAEPKPKVTEKVQPKQIKDNKKAKVEPEKPEELENESKQVDDGDLLETPETGPPPKPFSMGLGICLLYTSPSPRDLSTSRMPSSA